MRKLRTGMQGLGVCNMAYGGCEPRCAGSGVGEGVGRKLGNGIGLRWVQGVRCAGSVGGHGVWMGPIGRGMGAEADRAESVHGISPDVGILAGSGVEVKVMLGFFRGGRPG